jgi:translation initiation factor 2D
MFKKDKDLEERSRSLLKNKEIRKFRSEILASFPLLNEAEITELIPNKCDLSVIKLATKTLIYNLDNIPVFYDLLGRNNLFPTIYTLWRYKNCLRKVIIFSPVSEYLMRGADLMLPGCKTNQDFSGLVKGEKVSICVDGNPSPFAVGISETNQDSLSLHGMKGKGVSIAHIYGDELWKSGGSLIPNDGFADSYIYPIEGKFKSYRIYFQKQTTTKKT